MWWIDHYSGAFWPMLWIMMMAMISVMICTATMFFIMVRGLEIRFRGENALDILKERLGRGEIDQGEYTATAPPTLPAVGATLVVARDQGRS
jgi:uncharacterized membrane protein